MTVSFSVGRFGSPTKIDYSKKGNLILTSLLEDLAGVDKRVQRNGGKGIKLLTVVFSLG